MSNVLDSTDGQMYGACKHGVTQVNLSQILETGSGWSSGDGLRLEQLCRLIALKNIYSKQLPNMPREYITRLVFDRRHRSVAIVKRDGLVVGGITYRPFHSQASFQASQASTQV